MILGYWDIHGLASPIRTLLEIVGADFENKVYPIENKEEWFKEKNDLGLLFPNLPYLIDGETKITEHLAILRYIAKKYNLAPENDDEIVLVDQVENHVFDIRFKLYLAAFDTANYEKSKKEYIRMVSDKLEGLEKLLSNNTYIVGEKFTYVDIYVHDFLILLNAFENELLQSKPNLMKYLNHMNELPTYESYKNSDKWEVRFLCGPKASFKEKY